MPQRLENRAIIVVGAGTKGEGVGNGKAAAIQFANEGAMVFCVDKDGSAAESTAKAIKDAGGSAEACEADIVKFEECEHIVDMCLKEFKKIDVLHNNVGITSMMEIVDTTEKAWDNIFDINVKGMFIVCKLVIPHMIKQGGGTIINVSSLASMRAFPDVAYMSSKGAVDSLTRYIAGRYGRYNIRANALLLGYIDTPLARPGWENDKIRQINLRQIPMYRFASPMEVASVAAFLASDEASYINGVVLPVDGGLSISI